jgi:hypothetical protein
VVSVGLDLETAMDEPKESAWTLGLTGLSPVPFAGVAALAWREAGVRPKPPRSSAFPTQQEGKMTDNDPTSLRAPTFAGGTRAIPTTPVVGTPRRDYAEAFVPGEEDLEDGELRVTATGRGAINPESMRLEVTEFDFAGLSFVYSGDTCAAWPLVRAAEGCDLLIHEVFPPAAVLAAASGLSIERATIALNAAHTSPTAAPRCSASCGGAWPASGTRCSARRSSRWSSRSCAPATTAPWSRPRTSRCST